MRTRSKKTIQDNELEDEIARLAYELWAQDGYTHGNHGKHWLEAERQLRGPVGAGGNPAYPSKEERDEIISQNDHEETRANIPADKEMQRRSR